MTSVFAALAVAQMAHAIAPVLMPCTDAGLINRLVNDPTIRPHIGGDMSQPLDLTPMVERKHNVFLIGEHGGFAFLFSGPDVFESHAFVLPAGRGGWSRRAANNALAYMARKGAKMIWARVAFDAPHAKRFALDCGMSPAGEDVIDEGRGPMPAELFAWRSSI